MITEIVLFSLPEGMSSRRCYREISPFGASLES